MTIIKLETDILFGQLDNTTSLFLKLIESTNEKLIHIIPFKNSWTIAQLASHVTKSIKGIAQSMEMQGQPALRNADERVEEIKKTFLNFNIKFQSPEFILPTKTIYSKEQVVQKLEDAIEQLKNMRGKADFTEVISLPAFGEITKFELLNFVVFHTQRHIHQLQIMLKHLKAA
ncbi:MAG: DinB family protein [Parafilimonas sp.]|nr:DinB family protein [Parafilimonas sp.]